MKRFIQLSFSNIYIFSFLIMAVVTSSFQLMQKSIYLLLNVLVTIVILYSFPMKCFGVTFNCHVVMYLGLSLSLAHCYITSTARE